MLQLLTPALAGLFTALLKQRGEISSSSGVSEDIVKSVLSAAENHISKDERLQQQILLEVEQARQHDVATFSTDTKGVNIMRSSVRPVVTFVAMGWYVYARIQGVVLLPEDYAIIGGILAFWFGFRPFEKKSIK